MFLGAGTQSFLTQLSEAQCYNGDGLELVSLSQSMFVFYCIIQVVSAILSLLLAPVSAYYGGKLEGVPFVK